MATYSRLSMTEREEISRQLAAGRTLSAISRKLGRAASTVARELSRNGASRTTYRATRAHAQARARASQPRRARRLEADARLRAYVLAGLRRRWSPEQIARRLGREYPHDRTMRVSHETIYTYLYVLPRGQLRRELLRCLRQPRKQRRPRSRGPERRGKIPDMISIEERPAEVADRTIPGHWEGDLLLGQRSVSALGTLVERSTRTVVLVPLRGRDATTVRRAFAREIRTLPTALKRSLTYDQGKEMSEHRLFTAQTKLQVYFAHPHSPWERGTCENTNGLLRQFFPKGTDFAQLSRREIKTVEALLNGRPRKTLDFQTPAEAFQVVLLKY
ncbi:MAG: IS30 family transposase [Gemmatimonadota bacterium]